MEESWEKDGTEEKEGNDGEIKQFEGGTIKSGDVGIPCKCYLLLSS